MTFMAACAEREGVCVACYCEVRGYLDNAWFTKEGDVTRLQWTRREDPKQGFCILPHV